MLLPGAHLPLHIFEPRYRQLTADLINDAEPDREFGIVTIRTSLTQEISTTEQLHPVGCSTRLREAQRLPDGQYDILTTGHRRFRLLEIDPHTAPYLVGRVEWVDDEPVTEPTRHAATPLAELARAAHRRYCAFAWDDDWTEPPQETTLDELAYVLASDCIMSSEDRHHLLAETHPLRRLSMTCETLTRETGLLSALRAIPATVSQLMHTHEPHSFN